jgi:hypothetical protein
VRFVAPSSPQGQWLSIYIVQRIPSKKVIIRAQFSHPVPAVVEGYRHNGGLRSIAVFTVTEFLPLGIRVGHTGNQAVTIPFTGGDFDTVDRLQPIRFNNIYNIAG